MVARVIDWLFPPANDAPSSIAGRHLPQLDAVRGLAILAVTLYRFRGDDPSDDLVVRLFTRALGAGTRGVDLFFVLSGFLITGLLDDARGRDHYFKHFYIRRTLRIFPLYYGVLLFAFVVLPWFGTNADAFFREARTNPEPQLPLVENQGWLWTYTSNLLISFRASWCLGAFNHFWSLAVEEHFYLVWPLVVYAFPRRTTMRVCLALVVAATLARVMFVMSTANLAAAEAFTLFRLDGLACGAWLALAAREANGLESFRRSAVIVAGLAFFGLVPAFALRMKLATAIDLPLALFCGSVITLALTVSPQSWFGMIFRSRVLVALGQVSYAMYVFQNLLIPALDPYLSVAKATAWTGSEGAGRLVYLALMFAINFGLAWLSWHGYERWWLALRDRLAPNTTRA